VYVQEHEVWTQFADALHRFLAVPGFAQQPHVDLALQPHTNTLAHERLVVHNQHAQLSHPQS